MNWFREFFKAEEEVVEEVGEEEEGEEVPRPQLLLPQTPKSKKTGGKGNNRRASSSSAGTPYDDIFTPPNSFSTPPTVTSARSNGSISEITNKVSRLGIHDGSESPCPPSRANTPTKRRGKEESARVRPFPSIEPYPETNKAGKPPQELIEDAICKPLGKRDLDCGWIYILTDLFHSGHVKIGVTKDIPRRLDEHLSCGRPLDLYFPRDDKHGMDDAPNIFRVEKIIQEELYYLRKVVRCETGKKHKHNEWFEVNPDIAVEIAQKWMDRLRQWPYSADARDGQLPEKAEIVLKAEIEENFCEPHPALPDLSGVAMPPKRQYRRKS